MIDPILNSSHDVWNVILGFSDINTLITLTEVDLKINLLATTKLAHIKINIFELYRAFIKIQDNYTVRYRPPIQPSIQVANLGKFILMGISIQNGLVGFTSLQIIQTELKNLEDNRIFIAPNFGQEELGKILDDSVSKCDRLPITKISIRTKNLHPHLLYAINAAGEKANGQFYNMNGSFFGWLEETLYDLANAL